jgi:hypothetical protein
MPTPRPHRGTATQNSRSTGVPVMVVATVETQPTAEVNTEVTAVRSSVILFHPFIFTYFSFCLELATGVQETGKHAHAKTAERNADTEQQKHRVGKSRYTCLTGRKTSDRTGYRSNHRHNRSKNLANSGKQSGHYLHPLPIRILINFATKVKQTKLNR